MTRAVRSRTGVHPAALLCAAAFPVLFFVACSTGDTPTAGGGSDLPNGAVASLSGMLYGPDSTVTAGAEVILRRTVVTGHGDSLAWESSVRTDTRGRYLIDSVPLGRYVVFCRDSIGAHEAMRQNIDMAAQHEKILDDLYLGAPVDVEGHVILPLGYLLPRVRIFVPGTRVGVTINIAASVVHYVLNGVPPGLFDMVIVYGDVASVATMLILPGASPSVLLRDIAVSMLPITSDTAYDFHRTTTQAAYYVSPVAYKADSVPQWYENADFSEVRHYQHWGDGVLPWVDDSIPATPTYDVVVAGLARVNTMGETVLEAGQGQTLVLVGAALPQKSGVAQYTVAAGVLDTHLGRPALRVIQADVFAHAEY